MKRLLPALVLVLLASPLLGQPFEYSVKFTCGAGTSRTLDAWYVPSGRFYTIVNVHNPTKEEFRIQKYFSLALPGEKAGRIAPSEDDKTPSPVVTTIPAFHTIAIDCGNIYEHTKVTPGRFLDGYVVIESRVKIDVDAVYFAADRDGIVHSEQVVHYDGVPMP